MRKRIPLLHPVFHYITERTLPSQTALILIPAGAVYTLVLFILCFKSSPSLFVYLSAAFWIILVSSLCAVRLLYSASFVRPSESIKKTMKMMSESDLSSKAQLRGCSEIRELSSSLNSALEGVKLYIARINAQADVLNGVSGKLKDGSDRNSEAADAVKQAMTELSKGASDQAEHLSSTADSLQKLSTLIRKVTDDTADISVNSLSLSESADRGKKVSLEMDTQISRIVDSTRNISESVTELLASLDQVSKITSDIEDISEQTNLLSLNAAIEAARAGEHGLGFAVVAAETSKLSHRSMEATEMTKTIIEKMIKKSREVNSIIEAGVEQSVKGKKLSAEAQEKFNSIFSTLSDNLKQIGEIAESASVIAEKSETMSSAVSTIAAFGKQIIESTDHVRKVSEDQNLYTKRVSDLALELSDSAYVLKKSITIDLSISYFGNDKRVESTEKALALYTSANPYIRFRTADRFANGKLYYPILKTRIADRILPDIIQLDQPWLPGFLDEGDLFVNLLTEPEADLSGFEKSALDMCTVNGNLMGLPTGINSICLMCCRRFFDKHGIDAGTVWNWKNLLEIGTRIARENGKERLLYANYEFSHYLFKMYIRQKTGGQFIRDSYEPGFDTAALRNAFEYFKELYDSGTMYTTDSYGVQNNGIVPLKTGVRPMDLAFGMIFNWVSDYDRNCKGMFNGSDVFMTLPPAAPDAKTSAIIIKPQLVLSVCGQSANVREALKFLNWIYNDPEGIRAWGTSRGSNATKEASRVQSEAGMTNPVIAEAVRRSMENGGLSENPLSIHADITDLFNSARAKIYAGEITPEKAADKTMKNLHVTLRKMKKLKERKASKRS
jgi:methyl-accepting chemotaxis protein